MWLPKWFTRRNEPRPAPEGRVRILVLSMSFEDRILLQRLGKQHDWELRFTYSPREGFNLASRCHFQLILCDHNQPGYPWREVMDRLAACSPQSRILLVSPVNDDYLWRDVIQQGGYDVLLRPLREESALRAVQASSRFVSPDGRVSIGYQC